MSGYLLLFEIVQTLFKHLLVLTDLFTKYLRQSQWFRRYATNFTRGLMTHLLVKSSVNRNQFFRSAFSDSNQRYFVVQAQRRPNQFDGLGISQAIFSGSKHRPESLSCWTGNKTTVWKSRNLKGKYQICRKGYIRRHCRPKA